MFWLWAGFILLVLALLALDLGVFHRKDHVIKTKEALTWSAIWIALGLAFSVFIYFGYENKWAGLGAHVDVIDGDVNNGRQALIKYLTGYVIEKSLSVDNIFVIALLFTSFAIPAVYQHRVLFWGILGAIAMRGVMIYFSAKLVQYQWVIVLFAVILIITALRLLFRKEKHRDPKQSRTYKLLQRTLPFTPNLHGHHFKAHEPAPAPGQPGKMRLVFTPLALALVMVETTDLVFAIDSIPAIFAVTADPYLVFTSNVFAILGLRSLYFALAGMIHKFRYLKISLAIVLLVVGAKMLTAKWLKAHLGEHFNLYLLAVVFAILLAGVLLSLRANRRDARALEEAPDPTTIPPRADATKPVG
jgi:tellurite resistance protein TerC